MLPIEKGLGQFEVDLWYWNHSTVKSPVPGEKFDELGTVKYWLFPLNDKLPPKLFAPFTVAVPVATFLVVAPVDVNAMLPEALFEAVPCNLTYIVVDATVVPDFVNIIELAKSVPEAKDIS